MRRGCAAGFLPTVWLYNWHAYCPHFIRRCSGRFTAAQFLPTDGPARSLPFTARASTLTPLFLSSFLPSYSSCSSYRRDARTVIPAGPASGRAGDAVRRDWAGPAAAAAPGVRPGAPGAPPARPVHAGARGRVREGGVPAARRRLPGRRRPGRGGEPGPSGE